MKKKLFILFFLLCDAASAEGILPSWMRRNDGYEDPRRNGNVAPKTTENSKPANQNFYELKKPSNIKELINIIENIDINDEMNYSFDVKKTKNMLIINEKNIKDVLAEGAKQFEQQTGRQMTYGEMREMYG